MKLLLVFENKNVLRRIGHMFAERRILRVRHFEVCLDEVTSGGTLYAKAKSVTHVEHLFPNSPIYPKDLPIHCFDLVTIAEILERKRKGRGLIGESHHVFLYSYRFSLKVVKSFSYKKDHSQ